ncbi:MAG: sigma-70 family RNA polymerase sigma factor [Planctomycetes bacterium]|nr:sigma-70 family RNA polymerase sigma factor [Planctomycetota bacterium]
MSCDKLLGGGQVADASTLQEFIQSRIGLVYGVCRRILRQPSDIDDAVQETFIKFSRSVDQIHSNVDAWLHSCARTTALDTAKRLRSGSYRHRAIETAPIQAVEEREGDDVARCIDECIDELPREDRHVVLAHFFRDMTMEEIGDELGVSKAAVSKRLGKAVAVLRSKLARRGVAAASLTLFLSNASAATAESGSVERVAAAVSERAVAAPIRDDRRRAWWPAAIGALIAIAVTAWFLWPARSGAPTTPAQATQTPLRWQAIGAYPAIAENGRIAMDARAESIPAVRGPLRISGHEGEDPRIRGLQVVEPIAGIDGITLTFGMDSPGTNNAPHASIHIELYDADGEVQGAFSLACNGSLHDIAQGIVWRKAPEPDSAPVKEDVVSTYDLGQKLEPGKHAISVKLDLAGVTATVDGKDLPRLAIDPAMRIAAFRPAVYAAVYPECDATSIAFSDIVCVRGNSAVP